MSEEQTGLGGGLQNPHDTVQLQQCCHERRSFKKDSCSRLLLSCAGKFGPEVACGMHAEWGYQHMVPAVCMYTELRMYKTYLCHRTTPLSEHLCLILLKFALTCPLFLSLPYSYDVWAACKREYPKECK